jgi:hypothetical protein
MEAAGMRKTVDPKLRVSLNAFRDIRPPFQARGEANLRANQGIYGPNQQVRDRRDYLRKRSSRADLERSIAAVSLGT